MQKETVESAWQRKKNIGNPGKGEPHVLFGERELGQVRRSLMDRLKVSFLYSIIGEYTPNTSFFTRISLVSLATSSSAVCSSVDTGLFSKPFS